MTEPSLVPDDILELADAIEDAESVLAKAMGVIIKNHLKNKKFLSFKECKLEQLLFYLEQYEYTLTFTRHDPHCWVATITKPIHQTEGRTLKEAVMKMAYFLQKNKLLHEQDEP